MVSEYTRFTAQICDKIRSTLNLSLQVSGRTRMHTHTNTHSNTNTDQGVLYGLQSKGKHERVRVHTCILLRYMEFHDLGPELPKLELPLRILHFRGPFPPPRAPQRRRRWPSLCGRPCPRPLGGWPWARRRRRWPSRWGRPPPCRRLGGQPIHDSRF